MKKLLTLPMLCATALALAAGLLSTPAEAQWFKRKERMNVRGELSPDQQKRQGLKQARRYRSDYKQSHLDTRTYEFRPDRTGRKTRKDERNARKYRAFNLDRGTSRKFWVMFSLK